MFAKPKYVKKQEFFSVFATPSGQAQARLGIVVGKKSVRLAVQRSRIKRIIRESFRLQQAGLSGFDIVVVVKKSFNEIPNNFFAAVVNGGR